MKDIRQLLLSHFKKIIKENVIFGQILQDFSEWFKPKGDETIDNMRQQH